MEEREIRDLETIFAQVEDLRMERTKLHHLHDIILASCGVLYRAEGWVEIEEFGKAKQAWFTELLKLSRALDVAFREDASRVRQGHADENLAVLRHISLNVLRQETSSHVGIHARRLKAGWNNDTLFHVLDRVN